MATHQDDQHYDGKSLKRPLSSDMQEVQKKRCLMEDDAGENEVKDTQFSAGQFCATLTPSGCARVMWEVHDLASLSEAAKAHTVVRTPQVRSQTFSTGNSQAWRLIVYPNFNNEGSVGIFLEVSTIARDTTAYFTIDLHMQIYPGKYTRERQFFSTSVFSYYSQNFGWKKAISIEDYRQALNKPIIIECFVKPEPAENAKETHGHVGMVNEGTTCYLNSLLQTLYHISEFRKAVYALPTSEDETNTIPLCLQRVFYNLQMKSEAVATRELLSSFGWGFEELNTQHDVQEFNCVLSDTLDRKMKGTPVEGTCANLFEGVMTNFIKCINVEYESKREEKFIDLQLNVKGCESLMESFRKYLEVEQLKGDNLYDAEHFGKQEAEKGVAFIRLPPVLQLQLKRFEYDPRTDAMGKVHDRFTFPETLDLSEFLAGDYEYELFSVLIHSGTTAAGHYFAFIRPQLRDWMKFNDENVERVSPEYVNHCSFGGEMKTLHVDEVEGITEKSVRNEMSAYMLVYIQRSYKDKIIFNLKKTDVPNHLEVRFAREERRREELRSLDLQRRQNCDVLTVTKEMLMGWSKPGLTPCESALYSPLPFSKCEDRRFVWNLRKNMKISSLKRMIKNKLKDHACRLWAFTPGYQNWRLELLDNDHSALVSTVFDINKKALYIEIKNNAALFRKVETSDIHSPLTWELVDETAAEDKESCDSDSTAPLDEDEGDLLTAPLVSTRGVPVFYKWYQFQNSSSYLSLLDSVNIYGNIHADRLRDDIYVIYMEDAKPECCKVKLYIEKAQSLRKGKPDVRPIAADENAVFTTTDKDSVYYLEPGDVLIGEVEQLPAPAGYVSADRYLARLLDAASVRFSYHDKFEYYPFKSFSHELFESPGTVKELKFDMSLSCSQKDVRERLAQCFRAFAPTVVWEQVELYSLSDGGRRMEEVPLPEERTHKELGDLIDSSGVVYFDIMKFPLPLIKTGTLIHVSATQCVYIDSEFRWVKYFCELLRKGACTCDLKEHLSQQVKDLENGKVAGKQSIVLLPLVLHFRQRMFTEELKENTSLLYTSTSTQSLISLVNVGEKPLDCKVCFNQQKVFCALWFPDNEPAGDPFLLFVQKRESIREVLRRIVEKSKFPKPKLYRMNKSRTYMKDLDFTRAEVLEDSEDPWSAKYLEAEHVIIEVQRPRAIKQAIVLRDSNLS